MPPNVLPLNCGPHFRHAEVNGQAYHYRRFDLAPAHQARCSNGLLGGYQFRMWIPKSSRISPSGFWRYSA